MNKLTHDEYVGRVAEMNPNIEVLGKYINSSTKILHKCKIDGYEWMAAPSKILFGRGCPKCGGTIQKTHKEYADELAVINPNVEVLGEYVNNRTKILHRCKIDGHEWYASPNNMLRGHGCPVCVNKKRGTQEDYVKELSQVDNNLEVIGKYINRHTNILHRCKICGYEWEVSPASIILLETGCPVCCFPPLKIGNPPEYKNSIWASEHRDFFAQYMTEEQMKTQMPNSNKKTDFLCPDCGRHKMIAPNVVLRSGLGCICGDGISYPNKFVCSFFDQINIDFQTEYSPKWANGKKYDVYIPSKKCIIENHGEQHYEGWLHDKSDLKKQIDNDLYKKEIALSNGISYYIELDCRVSSIDWMKHSIMNSTLQDVLMFNLDKINWMKCNQFALSNLVIKSSNLWNSQKTIKEISQELHISTYTVSTYLDKAKECGYCDYSKGDGRNRRFRKIIRLKDNMIYATISEASKENNISWNTLKQKLKINENFMYYDEWLKIQ